MTDPRPENNVPPAGASGSSATIAWTGNRNSDDYDGQNQPEGEAQANVTEVAGSAEAALEHIDKLIGRINSNTSAAKVTPAEDTAEPAAHAQPGHEDEALQNYMDQFLERITGKKKPEGATPESVAVTQVGPVVAPEPEKTREIKKAPESVQDMSMMRELANESARQALGAHAGQRLVGGTRNTFLAALSLSLISSLLALTSLMGQAAWAWNSSLLVMLLAGVLTWRFLSLRGKLRRLNSDLPAGSAA
jgi:hypothetical protein